jgi:hypothetical protein
MLNLEKGYNMPKRKRSVKSKRRRIRRVRTVKRPKARTRTKTVVKYRNRFIKTRSKSRRVRSRKSILGMPNNVLDHVKVAALTGAGAIGGSIIANKTPVPENLKPLVPIALAIGILSLTKGNKTLIPVATGSILASLLTISKKISPNLSLAGSDIGLPVTLKGSNNLAIPYGSDNSFTNPIEQLILAQ